MYDHYHKVGRELSDENIDEQTILRLKITSQSMFPILLPGDYVLVRSIPCEKIHRGDLVVTRRSDGYLTHRLVSISPRGWITKGDQNGQADAVVSAREIVGFVFAFERGGRSYSLSKKFRMFLARIVGWLGWQEINCQSRTGVRFIRFVSHTVRFLFS